MRFFLLLLLLTVAAQAQLKWDKPVQKFDRSPEDREIEAHYGFRNTGATTITIKSLRSSCGCTTAKLEKKVYAPGESGEVTLNFRFGDRKGLYRKGVTVNTDEKAGEPAILNLVVHIHDPLTITPALVWWRRGEDSEAKSVAIDTEAGESVRVTGVSSSNPRFAASLVTGQAGLKYSVTITPTDTARKDTAEIKVQTDYPSDAPRTYTIHARIK
jgi:hypothetical protein